MTQANDLIETDGYIEPVYRRVRSKKESLNRWMIPDTVNTVNCTRVRHDSTYTDEPNKYTEVYVPEINALYKQWEQDNSLCESFSFMDKLIRTVKEEDLIRVLLDNCVNGYQWQRDFTIDILCKNDGMSIYTWSKVVRSSAIYSDTRLTNMPPISTYKPLANILNRGKDDLIIIAYIVYGMNYDR